MKTLKKTLCLVLAVVMVVGVLVIPANADYKDEDEIEYKEAVDVLTAIGVLEGDNGSFYPERVLTRAEACAIIVRMLGYEDIAVDTGVFSDIKGHWAAPVISVAYNEGVVKGVGGGKFNPDDKLTESAWATMLLRLLGKEEGEEFSGANWELNVAKAAKAIGLDDGLNETFKGSKECNRDIAAALAFEALNYTDQGEKTGKWVMNVNKTAVNAEKGGLTNAKPFENLDEMVFDSRTEAILVATSVDEKAILGTHYTLTAETDNSGSLAYEVFNELSGGINKDAFGRTTKVWSNKDGSVNLTFPQDALKEYTDSVTLGKIYTDLKLTATKSASYIEDGKTGGAKSLESGATASIGGKGSTTLVYATPAESTPYRIVVINTYVGTISKHNAAETNDDGQVTKKESIEIAKLGTAPTADLAAFETSAFTDADATNKTVVYYTAVVSDDGCTVKSAVAAKKVTGTVSKKVENTSITVAGTEYSYGAKAYEATATEAPAVKANADVYLDSHGYALYIRAAEGEVAGPEFAYVLAVDSDKSDTLFDDSSTNYAKLLLLDGSTVTANVGTATIASFADTFVTYTVKDGVYTLKAPGTFGSVTYAQKVSDTSKEFKIEKGKTSMTMNDTDGTKDIIASNATVYLVATKDADGKPVYTMYTGYGNVPSIEIASDKSAKGQTAVVYNSSSKIAVAVYVDATDTTKVNIKSDTTTSGLILVIGNKNAVTVTDENGTYKTFKAVYNGEATTLNIEFDTAEGGLFNSTNGALKDLVASSDTKSIFLTSVTMESGIVKSVTTAKAVNLTKAETKGTVKAADGLVGFGSGTVTYKTYTDTCPVYVVDKNNNITVTTVDKIETVAADQAYYTVSSTNSEQVTSIFILKDGSLAAVELAGN